MSSGHAHTTALRTATAPLPTVLRRVPSGPGAGQRSRGASHPPAPLAPVPVRATSSERRILEAAEEAFLETPVEQVKVAAIAEAAGVSVGTVYLHYGSKSGLHAAVLEDVQLEVLEYTMIPVQRSAPAEWADIVDHCRRWERIFLRDLDRSRLVMTLDLTTPSDPHAAVIRERIAGRFGAAVVVAGSRLGELVERGELRPCDPVATAAWIYSSVVGTVMGLLQLPPWLVTGDAAAQAFERQRMMLAQALLPPGRLDAEGRAPAETWTAPPVQRRS